MNTNEETAALIAEARRWANGHPNRRVSELIHGLVDALEAATRVPVQGEPNDDRAEIFYCPIHGDLLDPRMSRSYRCLDAPEGHEYVTPRATVPDAREHLHAKCDCVPDLGPAHCHLCTGEGSPVRWDDCEAVREIADVSEPVEVVLTTTDIEGLAHLLVQLSPATQKNSGATIRRLLREINIKEVGQ